MTELKLHGYQERAIEFCLKLKRVYLAIDMGLGKTAIALKVIQETKQKAIVWAPIRPMYSTWPEEIAKWTPELTYKFMHGPDKCLWDNDLYDILLINYEGLKWLSNNLRTWKKRLVVFDEASMLKSHRTMRFGIFKKAFFMWPEWALELSATPAPNTYANLWSQYYLLDKGKALGKNITTFRADYCEKLARPGLPVTIYYVPPEKEEPIMNAVAPITFRLEAKDYLKMPEITYNKIKCSLTPTLTRQYKELEKDFFLKLGESEVEAVSAAALSMKLRQFVQGGVYDENKKWVELHKIKLSVLKELVETSAGQPILCAIQFKGELSMLRKEFGSNVPLIAGGVPSGTATRHINAWNRGDIPLLFCHPASLSHGVNLQTGGHILVWYGLTWSLEQYLQLIGRLYRQGQRHAVLIHHILMSGTIDEAVFDALTTKDINQKRFLDFIKAYHKGKL